MTEHGAIPTQCIDIELEEPNEVIELEVEEVVEHGGTSDYRKLSNKPSINGTELTGNYNEIDPTVPSWAKEENKPSYTVEEVENAMDVRNEISDESIVAMMKAIFGY